MSNQKVLNVIMHSINCLTFTLAHSGIYQSPICKSSFPHKQIIYTHEQTHIRTHANMPNRKYHRFMYHADLWPLMITKTGFTLNRFLSFFIFVLAHLLEHLSKVNNFYGLPAKTVKMDVKSLSCHHNVRSQTTVSGNNGDTCRQSPMQSCCSYITYLLWVGLG